MGSMLRKSEPEAHGYDKRQYKNHYFNRDNNILWKQTKKKKRKKYKFLVSQEGKCVSFMKC